MASRPQSEPLPPAAVELLRPIRDGALIEDCREKFFERLAICVHDGLLTEVEAEKVALNDLRARLGVVEQRDLF